MPLRLLISALTFLWFVGTLLFAPSSARGVVIDDFSDDLPGAGTYATDPTTGVGGGTQVGLASVLGGIRQVDLVALFPNATNITTAEILPPTTPPPGGQILRERPGGFGGELHLTYYPAFPAFFDVTLGAPPGGPPARFVVRLTSSIVNATLRVRIRDSDSSVHSAEVTLPNFSGPGEQAHIFPLDSATFSSFAELDPTQILWIEVSVLSFLGGAGNYEISDISLTREDVADVAQRALSLSAALNLDPADLVLDRPPLPEGYEQLFSGGDDFAANLGADCPTILDCLNSGLGEPAVAAPSPLTLSWDVPAIDSYPIDPQIAVSSTHILIATSRIAIFEKNGTLVTEMPDGQPFKNPMLESELFEPLLPVINASLDLPPSLASQVDDDGNLVYAVDTVYDTRAVFDSYRKRFFVVSLARNSKARGKEATVVELEARRSKLLLAVSKSEDPRDGWYLYWWSASLDDGACYDEPCGCPSSFYVPGDASDYPSIGISENAVVITNSVLNKSPEMLLCSPKPSPFGGEYRYTVITIGDPNQLVQGIPSDGYHLWNAKYADGEVQFGILQPAHHHGSSPNLHYLVNTRGEDTLTVWGVTPLTNPNPPSLYRSGVTVAEFYGPSADSRFWRGLQPAGPDILDPRKMRLGDNLGNNVIKAVVRGGSLYSTFMTCSRWIPFATTCYTSIRLSKLGLSGFPFQSPTVLLDRTFGEYNPTDDPPETLADYSWPTLEVNSDEDVVVAYNRSGVTIFPESRFSIYFDGEADIRESDLLHVGEYTLGADFVLDLDNPDPGAGRLDLAGASVDPVDTSAIWIAHPYSRRPDPAVAEGRYRLTVGKIFGGVMPDWTATAAVTGGAIVAPGQSFDVEIRARNQGDGAAPATTIRLYLSTDPNITSGDILLGEFDVAALAAGSEIVFTVQVTVPIGLAPAAYHVGGIINPDILVTEYSDTNNATPRQLTAPLLNVVASVPTIGVPLLFAAGLVMVALGFVALRNAGNSREA